LQAKFFILKNTYILKLQCLLLFILLATLRSQAQSHRVDSLQLILHTAQPDTNKVKLLIALSDAYLGKALSKKNHEEALNSAKQAQILAESLGFESGRVRAIQRQANTYMLKMRIDSSLRLYQSILPYAEQTKNDYLLVDILSGIGTDMMRKGQPEAARIHLRRAADIAHKRGFQRLEAFCLKTLGATYMQEDRYNECIDTLILAGEVAQKAHELRVYADICFNLNNAYGNIAQHAKSLEWAKQMLNVGFRMRDTFFICKAYLTLGTTSLEAQSIDSSEWFTLRALELGGNILDNYSIVELYYNLASIAGLRKDYQSQLKWLLKSDPLELLMKGGINEHTIMGMNLRGDCYYNLGRLKEAEQCYAKAAKNAEITGDWTGISRAYLGLSQIAERNNPTAALLYYKKHITARDSLVNEKNTKKLTQIEMTHEFSQKQAFAKAEQDRALALRDARGKQQQLIFAIVVLGLLAAAGFIFYNYRQQQERRRTELELANLRAQINPHFIFNCLNSIYRYTKERDTDTAAKYLQKFSSLLRLVLENSRTEKITLARDLDALQLYVDIESLRFKEKLQYSLTIDPEIDTTFVQIPGMLIQPHVENAIWHGLMHRQDGGHISVRLTLPAENLLHIEIEDDGVGRVAAADLESKSALTKKSLGQKITAERLKGTGKLAFSETIDLTDANGNASGTKVIMEIPL
jgi:tetratricopeptide (TPR) repeat protein